MKTAYFGIRLGYKMQRIGLTSYANYLNLRSNTIGTVGVRALLYERDFYLSKVVLLSFDG